MNVMRAVVLVLIFTAPLQALSAQAPSYPIRPVRLIVPFPPSGGTDIIARVVGQKLGEKLGQQFVIDNRPGAASTIGAHIAANANPDGYTLLFVTASFAISASYYANLPYDSVRDFTPIGLIAIGPLLAVINPTVRATTMKEFITLARAAPLELNYASGGSGGINHLAAELLNSLAAIRLVHVPYKGAGPALSALVSGETQFMIATLSSSLPLVRSNKLRALAVAGEKRSTLVPEMPTISESGVRGYSAENWYGLLAPSGTPATIVASIGHELALAMQRDDMQAQLTKLGFESRSSGAAGFGAFLRAEIAKWSRVMKSAGVAPVNTR